MSSAARGPAPRAGEAGQTLLLLAGALVAILLGALVLGGLALALMRRADDRRAADLAALAAARAMLDAYPRLFVAPSVGGVADRRHLELASYLAIARRIAGETARRNGAGPVEVRFPAVHGALAPTRVSVTVQPPRGTGGVARRPVTAEAELAVGAAPPPSGARGPGEYAGPLAYRDGRPMRPDVAAGYDRLAAAAASEAGLDLLVVSGFRTDAEQAALFAAHPDPKWVAPPGTSLHRLATELDLGPAAAYGWLQANAGRFHFLRRYAWEPWHFGFTLNAGTTSVGYSADRRTVLPRFVPTQYAPAIGRAAQRWNVSAALLAAQLYQESGFNPFARSGAGALGIAQFMPATARSYGLTDAFDAPRAIDAEAHLMRDLLRQFGAVPLALAAYNAGPVPVSRCACVPAIPETQAYVAAILGLLGGAGDPAGAGLGGLEVRLVR